MLQLTIVRHAKTNQQSPTGSDFDRRLLPKGIAQGGVLKNYFQKSEIRYKEVFISTAQRTQQTFELIAPGITFSQRIESDEFYLTDFPFLFKTISKRDHAEPILLVGHNYGISDLAAYLTETNIDLRTGEVIQLAFDALNWQEISKGTGIIVERFRPEVD